jgi:hypothetical protein
VEEEVSTDEIDGEDDPPERPGGGAGEDERIPPTIVTSACFLRERVDEMGSGFDEM